MKVIKFDQEQFDVLAENGEEYNLINDSLHGWFCNCYYALRYGNRLGRECRHKTAVKKYLKNENRKDS